MFDDNFISLQDLEKEIGKIVIKKLPSWYKIPEIQPVDFIFCLTPIFLQLQTENTKIKFEDPFIKSIVLGFYKLTDEEWFKKEQVRVLQKILEMKIGSFHENLLGKFSEFETLKKGHISGCDVQKKDGSVIIEVKNRYNTTKGSDGKHIINLLKKHKNDGKKAIFTQINCPSGKVNRYGDISADIDIWNGREIYTYLSGRESFFDDLLLTIEYVFSKFTDIDSLKIELL